MMSLGKEGRAKEELMHLAAQYINIESNRESLITVTGLEIGDRGRHADILVTVLPEEKEDAAVEFLNRKRNDFWRYVEREGSIERIPSFTFIIDHGEKSRRRIDALLDQ